jgi:hypothetical protein
MPFVIIAAALGLGYFAARTTENIKGAAPWLAGAVALIVVAKAVKVI